MDKKKVLLCIIGYILFCITFYMLFPKYQIVYGWRINRITGKMVHADNEANRTEAIISDRESEREHREWIRERKRQGLPESVFPIEEIKEREDAIPEEVPAEVPVDIPE